MFGDPTPTNTEGIVFGGDGALYVSAQDRSGPDQLNTAGQIAKLDSEGSSTTLADEFRGVGPASIAFGQGDFDPCSLYVTSLFTPQMYRVGAGILGVQN